MRNIIIIILLFFSVSLFGQEKFTKEEQVSFIKTFINTTCNTECLTFKIFLNYFGENSELEIALFSENVHGKGFDEKDRAVIMKFIYHFPDSYNSLVLNKIKNEVVPFKDFSIIDISLFNQTVDVNTYSVNIKHHSTIKIFYFQMNLYKTDGQYIIDIKRDSSLKESIILT